MKLTLSSVRDFKASESLLRLIADFALVHVSMVVAIIVAIGVELLFGRPGAGASMSHLYVRYYWAQFIPLSFVFPLTFLLHGFYTRSRLYTSRYKALVAAQGALIGSLLFLSANYLFFRDDLIPRAAALLFAATIVVVIPLVRVAKSIFLHFFQISHRQAAPSAELPPERVLIVGGAGYIGSMLVRRLLELGKTVRVLDNLVYGDDAIRDLRADPRFELIVGDCRNIQNVVSAVRGADAIVHLAAIVGDPACEQDRQAALEINYAATRMMIEIAKGHGIRRFIFASSCSVYGATDYLADEKAKVSPISLYAQTKVDSETALIEATTDSFWPIVLRFATVFGHSFRPRFDLVVNLVTAKACKESVITIYNGQQWRPFIHVRDVTEAIIKMMNAPPSLSAGQIYNVGDSRLNYTLTQVAEKIQELFPKTQVKHEENADGRNYRVSFDKIQRHFGFECLVTLEEGIREMQQAFVSGLVSDYTDVRFHNQRFLERTGVLPPPKKLDGDIMAAFAQPAAATASSTLSLVQ